MDSDLCLISNIKQKNDSDSLKELIDRHSGIFVDTVNKTVSASCHFVDKGSLLEDKDYYIYNAALKYDADRNTKFSTYLANETRWMCLNVYNKNKKMIQEPLDDSFKEKVSDEDFLQELQTNELVGKVFELAKKNPDKRIKKILDMRYCVGYNKVHSWREISSELNLSIQGCIDIHDKFIQKIKKEITNA